MGLVTIENLENNTPATANAFNERFQKLAQAVNNISSENLVDGAVTAAKISADVFSRLYPVGSVYTNATDNTNPATLLGFGTWAAFGEGRVPVGKADSGTFNAAGNTGGEESHVLTETEMPSHTHGVNDPGHSHGMSGDTVYTSGGGSSRTTSSGSGQQLRWSVGGTTGSGTGVSVQANGGGSAHNNLQPYVVVYMWRRTA